MEATIKFSVNGYVKQRIDILVPTLSVEDIVRMLRDGEALTTIQEDGQLIRLSGGEILARVIDVDNNCEYSDYEGYPFI